MADIEAQLTPILIDIEKEFKDCVTFQVNIVIFYI